jgi:quercetin dioxygenase-like cupin family protein
MWYLIQEATRMTDNLPSEPAQAAGLVEYQSGSVVSRTVVAKSTGTVTLFAFDEGEGLSEHTAPFDALVQIVDGEAEITVADTTHRVRAGELLLMPADIPHALHAASRFKMILTMIKS